MRFRKPKSQPDAQGYYPTIPAGEIAEDSAVRIKIKGRQILITRYEGEYYAFSAFCPHAAGDLSAGQLYKGRIDCPDHAYRFDIRSGRTLWPPDESYRLKIFPVRVVDGTVHVLIT